MWSTCDHSTADQHGRALFTPWPLNPCLILEAVEHPLKESHSAGRLAEQTPQEESLPAPVQSTLPPPFLCSPWLINHTPAARRVPCVILCLNYQQQFGSSYWNDSYKYAPVHVCERGSLCGTEPTCPNFWSHCLLWNELVAFAHNKAQRFFIWRKSDRWGGAAG